MTDTFYSCFKMQHDMVFCAGKLFIHKGNKVCYNGEYETIKGEKEDSAVIQENQRLFNRLNAILDGIIVFFSFLGGYWIRFYVLPNGVSVISYQEYVLVALALVPLHLLTYAELGLYESRRQKRIYQEMGTLLKGNVIDLVILLMVLFVVKTVHFSRLAIVLFFIFSNTLLGLKRIVTHKALDKFRSRGFNQKRVLVVGCGETIRSYTEEIKKSPYFGYELLGYVSDCKKKLGLGYLGKFDQLGKLLETHKPDEVVICLDTSEYERMPDVIQACEKSGVKVSLIPFYVKYISSNPQFDSVNGLPMINLRRVPLDNLGNAFMKRSVDIVGSLILILLTSPIMLIAAIGVKLSSPGPIIFAQERVGKNKKLFRMYKFRSMRVNDKETTGWSTNSDSRKTKFGAFIRKFSIDELPQFFNVLKGDMSLVGPRPELPYYVDQFKEEVPRYMVKHQVRPGITGWAQVHGFRGDTSIPERIRHDIYYIENWSFALDIKILFMTLVRVVNKETLQ